MFVGKLVFAQVMDFLPLHTFRRCVARYPSSYPTKTFSHLDQYLSMAFAQLTFRESLRDIEVCLRAKKPNFIISAFAAAFLEALWPMPTRTATGASIEILPTH